MTLADPVDRFALTGRRVLVTGGSLGIGRAIAVGCSEAGADVAIQFSPDADAAFDCPEAGEATCAAIANQGGRSVAIPADFAHAGEARRTVEETRRALGGLDIVVICAAIQKRSDFAAITRADMDRQFAVNLSASVELLQAALPGMEAQHWGRVLSIGSVNALVPDPELAVYAALKAAHHNLVANLARQYAKSGVTLNTLSPGLIATERNRARRRDAAEWAAIQAAANPMERAGLPEELVGAALMFCSAAGSFITGADLQVTGGGHL